MCTSRCAPKHLFTGLSPSPSHSVFLWSIPAFLSQEAHYSVHLCIQTAVHSVLKTLFLVIQLTWTRFNVISVAKISPLAAHYCSTAAATQEIISRQFLFFQIIVVSNVLAASLNKVLMVLSCRKFMHSILTFTQYDVITTMYIYICANNMN